MSPALFDVKCKGCIFFGLCVAAELPHCTGIDYYPAVKEKKDG